MQTLSRIRLLLLGFFAVLPLSGAVNAELKDDLEEVSSRTAPPFENVQWLTEAGFTTQSLAGKVLLVNFWATWCPPCVEELPSMHHARDQFSRDDFEVIAVNAGEKVDEIQGFLNRLPTKLTFPIIVDQHLTVYADWRVRPLPTTFLVDRSGRIRYQAIGGRNYASDNILAVIRKLIDE